MFNEALFYSFAIIAALLSPSDGIPLSFCEQIYFVCSRRSVAALQTCDLYRDRDMNQLLKGRGAGRQQLIVFFFLFFSGLSPRLRERQRVQASA